MNGIIAARGRVVENYISLPVSEGISEKLVLEFFGRTEIVKEEHGRIFFKSSKLMDYTEKILSFSFFDNNGKRCENCNSCFLRGVFIASGRITDPASAYHLEFSLGEAADKFSVLFAAAGFEMKKTVRKGERLLYVKNSSVIEDFFAYIGSNNAVFSVMNNKIESDVRNSTNRIVNCETNNITKAVNASKKQIAAIEALEEAKLLSSLPPELEATARLRLLHKDLSISQLSQISVPPISKPGLSHRLKKIMEFSEKALSDRISNISHETGDKSEEEKK